MIEILMATYNGGIYLKAQLDSIMTQDYTDFLLTIRDDGSKDDTLKLIRSYMKKYPNKIRLIEDEPTQYISAKSNFRKLLMNATEDNYYCLCAQDDVWKYNKLSKQFTMMKQMEAMSGPRTPILVHSDMELIDLNGQVINPSYVKYANIKPEKFTLKRMMVENCIVGLSCMFNAPLIKICKNIPDNAVSHDWWIGLYATSVGKVGFIKDKLVGYRQHGNNTVGAISGRGIDIIKNYKDISNSRFDTQKSYYQALEFLNTANKILNPDKMKIINAYASLANANKFVKVFNVLCKGYTKNSIVGSIVQAVNS